MSMSSNPTALLLVSTACDISPSASSNALALNNAILESRILINVINFLNHRTIFSIPRNYTPNSSAFPYCF